MSTTTNFKRIALVAVAALGLGVLSSVPSQATINSDAVTLSSATAAQTTAETYTASSAVATVSFFGAAADSLTITAALISTTAAGNTSMPVLRLVETSSAWVDTAIVAGSGAGGQVQSGTATLANVATRIAAASGTVTTTAKYAVYLATSTGSVAAPTTAGTYVVKLTPTAIGVGPLVGATAQTLTITVSTAAIASTTPSTATSTSYMYAGEPIAALFTAATKDSSIVVVKTANATTAAAQVATIKPTILNAASGAVSESLTVTITGPGQLGTGASTDGGISGITAVGRSISVKSGDAIGVFSDGTAGTSTITVVTSTTGVTIKSHTVTFTATTPTTFGAAYLATGDSSVVLATKTTKVWSKALDGTNPVQGLVGGTGGDYWVISSDTAVVTVTTYPGSMDVTELGYGVVVTGVAVGTATLTFANASTLAAATIKSAPISIRVGSTTPSNVTVTTDKATYAPGEKITMTVTILDSTAKAVVGATSYADIFSATGVTSSMNLSSGTLPAKDIADYSNSTNTKTFTLYAPVNGGTLTFSWTGGTGLATANQVAKTTVVTVTDSGAAALAAVTALATTVASLKTLITTLTNLVLKIQKKVKA
jgi:hypothetical protein